MEQNVAQEILIEVRQLGTQLGAKIDGVRDELKTEIKGVEGRLDTKIDRVHEDLLGRFEQLHVATEFTHDRLAKKIDALEVEIVRNSRKRR